MASITLLTDFGTRDEYVGVMKGVIERINPHARVIDISHAVAPQDIVHGAYLLAATFRFFASGTVHVAVVDPGVGGRRRILAAEGEGYRFLAPDNGLLERVMGGLAVDTLVSVENRRFFLSPVSRTFHGRDIFAPVAAHLAKGLPLRELGPAIDRSRIVDNVLPGCRRSETGAIEGVVIAVDRFGNLMTNIEGASIEPLRGRNGAGRVAVELAGQPIGDLVDTYQHVEPLAPLAIIGSRGLLEISVNGGDARQMLGAQRNDPVRVAGAENQVR